MTRPAAAAAALLALALLAAPAAAQTAAPQPEKPQTAAPAQPEPTAEQVALARDIITILDTDNMSDQIMGFLLMNGAKELKTRRPDITDDELKVYVEVYTDQLKAAVPGFLDKLAAAYARQFTTDDLTAIKAFFTSPAGQKFIASEGAVREANAAAGEAWQQENEPKMQAAVKEEMKKRGFKGWD